MFHKLIRKNKRMESKKIKLFILFIFFIVPTLWGEFRIWKDQAGNTFEGEYVSQTLLTVVLQDRTGKTVRVPINKLSEEDQKFLTTSIAPELELLFSKNQDRRKSYWGTYSDVTMVCRITVNKVSAPAYTARLTVTLVIVGKNERRRNYLILDKAQEEFDFVEAKSFSLKGKKFTMRQSTSSDDITKYIGFLAVVTDKKGEIIAIKSNRKEFITEKDTLLKAKRGDSFDRKFEKE